MAPEKSPIELRKELMKLIGNLRRQGYYDQVADKLRSWAQQHIADEYRKCITQDPNPAECLRRAATNTRMYLAYEKIWRGESA